MPKDLEQFDEEIKIDIYEDPSSSSFGDSVSTLEEPAYDPYSFPLIFDDQKRVIRPLGQAEGSSQTYGDGKWQGATQTLTGTTTIQPIAKQIPVAGSGGSVSLQNVPCIANGTTGQELILKGTSDSNTVRILDGYGTRLAGPITLGLNDTLSLYFDGSVWVETARTNWVSTTTSSSSSSSSSSSVSTSSSSTTTTP